MPLIRGSLRHLQPLVHVSVGRSAEAPDRETYRALIDTGATRTCIARRIIERHQLEPRARMLVQSASSAAERRRAYAFSLGVFCETADHLGLAKTLYVLPGELVAPDFQDNESFDVLIGMDFLSLGRFVLERQDFTFEFSLPT